MIEISKSTALAAIETGRLPPELVGLGITIVMKRTDARRWLAALRDGKQRQAKGVLYERFKGHCCLGLEQAANWGGRCEVSQGDGFAMLPSEYYLQQTGKMYFHENGFQARSPFFKLKDGSWQSADMLNDEGKSFAQIADLIEQHIAVY